MKIYHFDHNGLFIGESDADRSPLENEVFLIPANATNIKPPEIGLNQIQKFNGVNWSVIADFRGFKYWTSHNVMHEILNAGELLPSEFFTENPPKTQNEIDLEISNQAKNDLIALDLASIRSIREYIASKADAPQILKEREAAAIAARAKIK